MAAAIASTVRGCVLTGEPPSHPSKTTELTRLQVGQDPATPANIIVSTLLEAENLTPLLQSFQSSGRAVNVLYAFPLYPSALPRLAALATALGPGALALLLDHPAQVPLLAALAALTPHTPLVFLKIDVATHRAGARPDTPAYAALLPALVAAHAAGHARLHGLYAHAGHSYAARDDRAARAYLTAEFRTLARVAADLARLDPTLALTLSVGATPTATALQLHHHNDDDNEDTTTDPPLAALLAELKQTANLTLEVHAGVYPTLDLQQLATHARDARPLLASRDIAVSVVAEVASVYVGRGAAGSTEALINAGSLALGREPVGPSGGAQDGDDHDDEKAAGYCGWGIVMPWGQGGGEEVALDPAPRGFPAVHGGWQVGRISQEHGILVWKGAGEGREGGLRFGQRVRVWPNHSCIAGAGFGHYLVVDSRREGNEDEVVDVWERWNGW